MLLQLTDVNKIYNGAPLLKHISLTIEDRDRIGLIGVNGCGKSTLLKLITERILPDHIQEGDGEIIKSSHTSIGYLEQMGGLEKEQTVWHEMHNVFQPLLDAQARMRELEQELANNSEAAAEEAVEDAATVLEAEPPQPVNASAETAEAAIAALRKLRREIMVTFFITVNSFPGAGGKSKRPAPLAGRVLQIKTTLSLCVIHKDRIGKVRFCGATLLALLCKLQSLSRRANTPLSCNGDFRPKLLGFVPVCPALGGPRNSAPLSPVCTVRAHCRCAVQVLFRLIGLIALYTLLA